MPFEYLKALHIIFIVTWFAGLFYLPRLFIYIVEAHEEPEPEKTILLRQLKPMASRLLFGITLPSAVITLVVGIFMLVKQPFWLELPFMHLKLILVLLLYGFHFSLHLIWNQLNNDIVKYSSMGLRIWNEVATLFLISIVFLIVVKTALSIAWGLAGLIVIIILILGGIMIYKKFRK
jgi:protoporphyrinogen IX oxidase